MDLVKSGRTWKQSKTLAAGSSVHMTIREKLSTLLFVQKGSKMETGRSS